MFVSLQAVCIKCDSQLTSEPGHLRTVFNKLAMKTSTVYTVYATGEIVVDLNVAVMADHPVGRLRTLPCVGTC